MSEQKKLKFGVEHFAARTLLKTLSLLPRSWAFAIGRGIGYSFFTLGGKRLNRTGWRNMELVMSETSMDERKRILRGCYVSLGRMLGAISQFPRINAENVKDLVLSQGLEHFYAALERGKGVILVSGHLGAWELTTLVPILLGEPCHLIVKRQPNSAVEDLVDQVRGQFGNKTIDKSMSARSIYRLLKKGKVIGTLIDLNAHWHEGIYVDFFGRSASTSDAFAKLAIRTGAAVVPGFFIWDEDLKRYRLIFEPAIEIERTDNEEEDVHRMTAEATAVIERYVRRYPDQWWWIHKRWNTQPPGTISLYKDKG